MHKSETEETGPPPQDAAQAADGVVGLLKQNFARLTPQLRKAARHAIDNPSDIAIYSMREVAKRAGVTHSAMVRLARELGFDSYDMMRDRFREIVTRPAEPPWLTRARSVRDRFPAGSDDAILGEQLLLEMDNLQQTFAEGFAQTLMAAAHRLRTARRVYVLGLRSMFPLAYSFHYAYRMFDSGSVLMTGLGGALADDLRSMGKGDVLLVFSFRPYARDAVAAAEFAASRGGRLVVVTDSAVSPFALDDSVTLVAANGSASLFPSVTAAMAVSQLLITLLFSRGEDAAMERLKEAQSQLDRFDVYLGDTP